MRFPLFRVRNSGDLATLFRESMLPKKTGVPESEQTEDYRI